MTGETDHHPLVEFLPWDSDFFGIKIGKVRPGSLNLSDGTALCTWAQSRDYGCLYWLADTANENPLGVARQTGFIFADLRLELARPLSAVESPLAAASIRPAMIADLNALEAIARETQRDTRFIKDQRFPPHRAHELYATWIARDFAQKRVLVFVDAHNAAVGFISFYVNESTSTGQIGLLSVAASHAGHGIGQRLIRAALHSLASLACPTVEVVTQGSNVAAQRAYQACGFKSIRSAIWFHRWF